MPRSAETDRLRTLSAIRIAEIDRRIRNQDRWMYAGTALCAINLFYGVFSGSSVNLAAAIYCGVINGVVIARTNRLVEHNDLMKAFFAAADAIDDIVNEMMKRYAAALPTEGNA